MDQLPAFLCVPLQASIPVPPDSRLFLAAGVPLPTRRGEAMQIRADLLGARPSRHLLLTGVTWVTHGSRLFPEPVEAIILLEGRRRKLSFLHQQHSCVNVRGLHFLMNLLISSKWRQNQCDQTRLQSSKVCAVSTGHLEVRSSLNSVASACTWCAFACGKTSRALIPVQFEFYWCRQGELWAYLLYVRRPFWVARGKDKKKKKTQSELDFNCYCAGCSGPTTKLHLSTFFTVLEKKCVCVCWNLALFKILHHSFVLHF